MKKTIIAVLLNSVLPLFFGLAVYLLFYKNTYINSLFGINLNFALNGFTGVFVKCWLCDILWSYALTNAVYTALFAFKRKILLASVLSICLSTAFEMLQYFNLVKGTFDILDILFEITAILLAVFIIKRREEK